VREKVDQRAASGEREREFQGVREGEREGQGVRESGSEQEREIGSSGREGGSERGREWIRVHRQGRGRERMTGSQKEWERERKGEREGVIG